MSAIHPKKKKYWNGVTIKHSILHPANENDKSDNFALLKYQVNVNSSPRRVERPTKPRAPLLHYSYIRPTQTTLIYQGQNRHFPLYWLIFHVDPTYLT